MKINGIEKTPEEITLHTLSIEVKRNPKSWSHLASAIIKNYQLDKNKNPSAYIDPEWLSDLTTLATRYTGLLIKCDDKQIDDVKQFYLFHSFKETCSKFGLSQSALKYFLDKNKIRKQKTRK